MSHAWGSEGSRLEVLAWWLAAVRLGWGEDESQERMNPPGNTLAGRSRMPSTKPEGMGRERAAREGDRDGRQPEEYWAETMS